MAIDAGIVSAYGFAVAHGYTGTPASVSGDSLYVVTNCSFPKKYDGTNAQGVFNALVKSYKLMCWNNEIRA